MAEIKAVVKAATAIEKLPHAQRMVALAFVEGLLTQMQIQAAEAKTEQKQ